MSSDTNTSEITNIYHSLVNQFASPQDAWVYAHKHHKSNCYMESKGSPIGEATNGNNESDFQLSGFPTELVGVHCYAPSPSARYVAIVRTKEENTEYYIEIWNSSRMICNMPTKGKLGAIYNDEWFGGIAWSPDETKVAFIAQPFVKNSVSFWNPEDNKDVPRGHQYDFVEDWGEAFINKSSSRIFIADITAQSIQQVPGIAEEVSAVGQVSWGTDSKTLAFVGWKLAANERKLGIKYCYNRHYSCQIFTLNTSQESPVAVALTKDFVARSPRFSLDGLAIIYIASPEIKSHNTCFQLRKETTTIVDIVEELKSEYSFPGLFVGNLASRCFLDTDHILLDSIWHSAKVLLMVNLSEKKVERVKIKGLEQIAWVVSDVNERDVLAIGSTLNSPPTVYHARYDQTKPGELDFTPVVIHDIKMDRLSALRFDFHMMGTAPQLFEYMSLAPADAKSFPLVVYAHGGPHSSFTNEFSHTVAFLALLGYGVILINYRGSLGFGKKLIEDLAGHISETDVADCVTCIDHFVQQGQVDKERIVYIGGSHGGFLGGHLLARDPRIKAAVLRNPVTNIASMFGITDIPDWCTTMCATTDLQAMFKMSPMANVKDIKSPTMFLLGDVDKRVPISQGTQMYYALKEQGVPTAIKMYPKNGHAISKAECEADAWVNAALWYKKYLQ